jgi:hypothetical protein
VIRSGAPAVTLYKAPAFRFSSDIDIVRDGQLEATNYFFSLGDQENVLELTYNHDGRTHSERFGKTGRPLPNNE